MSHAANVINTEAPTPDVSAPELRPIVVVLIAAGHWTGMTALIWLNQLLRGVEWKPYHLCSDLPVLAAGTIATILLHMLVHRLRHLPFAALCVVATLAVLATALAFDFGFKTYAATLGVAPDDRFAISIKSVLIGGFFWSIPLGLGTALDIGFLNYVNARWREQRLLAALTSAREAQLQALRYQINPHFLYNTLNSVAALILDARNVEAENTVVRLANFFRTTLQIDPSNDIRLDEEVAVQKLYLDIERVRFGDRLSVGFDIAPGAEHVRVPALLLQPLVENAVKHGLSGSSTIARVDIAARMERELLVLEVADNGAGSPSRAGLGVGLANVRNRLMTRFGDKACLESSLRPTGGYVARISIPLAC